MYKRPSFCWRSLLPSIFSTILCLIRYHQLNWIICLPPSFFHRWCRRTDLHWRQPIWLQQVGCLAHTNARRTMLEHQIIMLEIQWAKTLKWGNPQINFIHHRGIVSHLRNHHFQALPSSPTLSHPIWHEVRNQALVVQPKDIRVMGHRGKDITSPQGGYGGLQMFLPQQFTQQGPSSPATPRVPPSPTGIIPANRPTSSSSPPYGQIPSTPGRPSISLPTKRFQLAAELRRIDVAEIADLPPSPDNSYAEFDADAEINDSLDFSQAEGKAPISLKQTEFSLKQFAKRMGQPNFSAFNKRKKVWVAAFLQKKYRCVIPGQNCLKQLWDGPLHKVRRLQILWWLSRPGCLWKFLIMRNGFNYSWWRSFWSNVQVRFGMRGKREGVAPSDRQQIWECSQAKKRKVTSQSSQIQLSWL